MKQEIIQDQQIQFQIKTYLFLIFRVIREYSAVAEPPNLMG